MSIKAIILAGYSFFWGLTKSKLIEVILSRRDEYTKAQAQIKKLKAENATLKEALKQHQINAVNSATNKPSSKQAEGEDKASKTDQNKADKKKKKNKRTRKPTAGAGNKAKHRKPDRTQTATVDQCDLCGKDLTWIFITIIHINRSCALVYDLYSELKNRTENIHTSII